MANHNAAIGTPGTVHSTDGATGSSWAGGTVSTGLGSINSAGEIARSSGLLGEDPTAPSLGDGWCLLGTVTVFANTTSLQVSYSTTGTAPPDEVCLLQQTTATTYTFSSIPAISGPWKASYWASYCVILYP